MTGGSGAKDSDGGGRGGGGGGGSGGGGRGRGGGGGGSGQRRWGCTCQMHLPEMTGPTVLWELEAVCSPAPWRLGCFLLCIRLGSAATVIVAQGPFLLSLCPPGWLQAPPLSSSAAQAMLGRVFLLLS